MINTKDQEELFKLVAQYLSRNILCVAVGGTAMMFNQYKTTTKDIDLVFQTEEDRNAFINAIVALGYREQSLGIVYDDRRKKHSKRPVMYTRGDERFDLFVKSVFGYKVGFVQEKMVQRYDFLGKKELTVLTPRVEELVLLKAITGRDRDYEDIETILDVEKTINWEELVGLAIAQKKSNSWILIDLEETLQRLRKKFFIKQEIFDAIYEAQGFES